jgi:hypothetical protein
MQDPISKIIKAKRVGDMAQVVECLTSKFEALILTSSPTKRKQFVFKLKLTQKWLVSHKLLSSYDQEEWEIHCLVSWLCA